MLCNKMSWEFVTFGFYIVSSHLKKGKNGIIQPWMDIEKFAVFISDHTYWKQSSSTHPLPALNVHFETKIYEYETQ